MTESNFDEAKAAYMAARERMADAALSELCRLVGCGAHPLPGSQHVTMTLVGEYAESGEVGISVTELDGQPVAFPADVLNEALLFLAATTGNDYVGVHHVDIGTEQEACGTCHGTGYLLDQTYGNVELPSGWVPVQACDECGVFTDDEAVKAAAAERGVAYGYWGAVPEEFDDDRPGDWGIFWSGHR